MTKERLKFIGVILLATIYTVVVFGLIITMANKVVNDIMRSPWPAQYDIFGEQR